MTRGISAAGHGRYLSRKYSRSAQTLPEGGDMPGAAEEHCMDYRILPVGDSALTIIFGNEIDPETSRIVRIARRHLAQKNIEGVTEYVQTYATLMVHYRPPIRRQKTNITQYANAVGILFRTDFVCTRRNFRMPNSKRDSPV